MSVNKIKIHPLIRTWLACYVKKMIRLLAFAQGGGLPYRWWFVCNN